MSGQDDRDNSSRLACGTVDNFGLSKDAIQIWLDVQQLINLGLTATYVRDVIEAQNRNIATGKLGQAPAPEGQAFEYDTSLHCSELIGPFSVAD